MTGEYNKQKRIIGIGDLHGDIIQLLSILKDSNLIRWKIRNRKCLNEEDYKIKNWEWIGGDSFVVQMGDIFDGGGRKEIDEFEDNEVEIFIFLVKLKCLAKKSGGNVLLIFGNHEYMNFIGNYSYVQKGSMKKCIKGDNLNLEYKRLNYDCNDRNILFKIGEEGILSKLMSRYSYGIIKIGNNLFCHGGLHLNIAKKYSIKRMNELLKKFLLNKLNKKDKKEINDVYGNEGIIWFREYVSDMTKNCEELNETLKRMDSDRMIVGHTVQRDGISMKCKKFKKNLFAIDVGLSRAFNSKEKCEYLEILNDNKINIRSCNIILNCR